MCGYSIVSFEKEETHSRFQTNCESQQKYSKCVLKINTQNDSSHKSYRCSRIFKAQAVSQRQLINSCEGLFSFSQNSI